MTARRPVAYGKTSQMKGRSGRSLSEAPTGARQSSHTPQASNPGKRPAMADPNTYWADRCGEIKKDGQRCTNRLSNVKAKKSGMCAGHWAAYRKRLKKEGTDAAE